MDGKVHRKMYKILQQLYRSTLTWKFFVFFITFNSQQSFCILHWKGSREDFSQLFNPDLYYRISQCIHFEWGCKWCYFRRDGASIVLFVIFIFFFFILLFYQTLAGQCQEKKGTNIRRDKTRGLVRYSLSSCALYFRQPVWWKDVFGGCYQVEVAEVGAILIKRFHTLCID